MLRAYYWPMWFCPLNRFAAILRCGLTSSIWNLRCLWSMANLWKKQSKIISWVGNIVVYATQQWLLHIWKACNLNSLHVIYFSSSFSQLNCVFGLSGCVFFIFIAAVIRIQINSYQKKLSDSHISDLFVLLFALFLELVCSFSSWDL